MQEAGKKTDWDWDADSWWDKRNLGEKIGVGIGLAILAVGLFALYGLLVQSLWNWLMPDLFGLGTMDYWQAFGLPFLIMLLFLGVGGGDKSSPSDRKRKKQLRRYIKQDQQRSEETPS